MVDKNYCMSSYLSLRYVEDDERCLDESQMRS